jgi:hypothetical protein
MPYGAAVRLLEMTTWGPTPQSVVDIQSMGPDAWLAAQFAKPASAWPDPNNTTEGVARLQTAFFSIALNGDDQLRQRASFALAQILVASAVKDTLLEQMVSYQRLIADYAFGTYRDVLTATTLNPSMGYFLDMVNNAKANPATGTAANENYARELMQLFTLGLVQLDSQGVPITAGGATVPEYDQFTVSEMAKDAIAVAQAVNAAVAGSSSLGVTFANTDIGTQLAQVAKLIQVRAALGATRQIFFCSQGGYDTHSNQLPLQVTLYTNLAAALAAFDQAMGVLSVENNVTTFTESDFSRTFQPNGNAGSDHGWGSHALVMGGAVNGGNLYGAFPTLALSGPDDSGTRGTWVPSTSQDQYGGALAKWFGLAQADLDYVFPNLHSFGYQTPAFV